MKKSFLISHSKSSSKTTGHETIEKEWAKNRHVSVKKDFFRKRINEGINETTTTTTTSINQSKNQSINYSH
jgi:hypothetical protein